MDQKKRKEDGIRKSRETEIGQSVYVCMHACAGLGEGREGEQRCKVLQGILSRDVVNLDLVPVETNIFSCLLVRVKQDVRSRACCPGRTSTKNKYKQNAGLVT